MTAPTLPTDPLAPTTSRASATATARGIARDPCPVARRVLAAVLAFTQVAPFGAAYAHDWPSPGPVAARPAPNDRQAVGEAPWPGLVWAGPGAGAPADPTAADCDRTPLAEDLPGREASQVSSRPSRHDRRLREGAAAPGAESSGVAPAATEDTRRARDSARAGGAGPAAESRIEADVAAAPRPAPATAPRAERATPPGPSAPIARRPAEPVSAGMVDDNADFGSFLDFRARHAGLPARALDVRERYRLVVHDARGRPVPDARVRVSADGRWLPLWARTDAGGTAWLHPGPALDTPGWGLLQPAAWPPAAPDVLQVEVRSGSASRPLHGHATLRRGQRDDLQVVLDGAMRPQRTRLDLVFLVDATGSMADEIAKLAESMRAMTAQIARLPGRPDLCLAMVAYRDEGDAFFVRRQDFTDDVNAFQSTLAALRAGGGGDTPEALNEALHTAVHRLSWRGEGTTRLVVLVGDAPPHLLPGDPVSPSYDDDLRAALARGIKLHAIGASGLDRLGELVFRQAAQFTGGRFVFLTYADARDPSSGPGRETVHEVDRYSVESLDRLIVRLVREELQRRQG